MLIDGRLIPSGTAMRADVVIIGSGPAGVTIAHELADAGINTMIVEGGGRRHRKEDDDSFRGESLGEPFPLVVSRQRGFGGTSGHWAPATGLRVRPFDEMDFQSLPSRPNCSWPFSRSTLDPYYARASDQVGVMPSYAADDWFANDDRSALTWPEGPELAVFQFARHDIFTRQFDQLAASPIVDLVLHSNVAELVTSPDGEAITSAEIVCADGNRFSVEARIFVLAAGGIDNARVLLASPGRMGNGVGNESDNVGRYFMDHISVDCGLIEPSGQEIDVRRFLETIDSARGKHQAMVWLGADIIRREGLLNAAFWVYRTSPSYLSPGVIAARSIRAALRSRPVEHLGRHAADVVRGGGDIASFALRRLSRRPSNRVVTSIRILAEQVPDRNSRIQLAPDRDKHGMRRVRMNWRIGTADLDSIAGHRDVFGRLLEKSGVGRIIDRVDPHERQSPVLSNYHHIGSTRMHDRPSEGVVDAQCRVHSTTNLYVAGSSVFPAGGYLNPTLTIVAMALRIADAVKRDIGPVAVFGQVS